MPHFHAVLTDECGMEFGAGCNVPTREEAYDYFAENYPESNVVQLEDNNDTAQREAEMYARVSADDYDYAEDW